jgi:hypothetical protein
MAHSRIVPKVADCIPNIERAGWRYIGYNRPWHRFVPNMPRADGKTEIVFTLAELRDAWTNGW